MNACLLLLCLSLSPVEDRWFGEDKWKHFTLSFSVTAMASGGARALGLDAESSALAGAVVGAGLGVWKEVRDDRTAGATVSARDLAWDLAGVATASVLTAQAR